MPEYNHKKIERHVTYADFIKNGGEEYWQTGWQSSGLDQAEDFAKKKKKYILIEFPYPSGAGLHVGHVRSYTALDIMSRMLRLQGYNVLYPIGWDAFGLPTENYAIKNKIHPRLATEANIKTFRRQLKSLGLSFDWSREVDTTDPKYYQWTQWIFLQLYKKGLAYKKKMPINWCPSCKIGLAHEEVVDGKCERCGAAVEQREKEQWLLAITKYADRLIKDLDTVDYLEKIKTQQVNWIGRSEGAIIKFQISINVRLGFKTQNLDKICYELEIFTTRPDTLFGATYVVLAPEHELVTQLKDQIKNRREVEKYINQTKTKSELQRTSLEKAKTGVELEGIKAINPANNEEIPVWIADYVLASYGTGAIMAVPAHDERDFEFAKKFKLPIKQVIAPETGNKRDGENVVQGGCGVVFDPKSQKYAVAAWNNGMIGLFSGNVGKTEDEQAGILREVTEESGLHDFLHIEKIATAYPHYYNSAKNSNRHGSAACYLAVLKTANMRPTKREAHEKFELQWHSPAEILNNWLKYNQKNDLDHWVWFLRQAVGKAIELGYDSTSDSSIFYTSAYTGKGVIINSGGFNGLSSDEAKKKITAKVGGKMKVQYKLRDWIFSRQHYWGEPIPMVYCEQCGWIPVPEKDLPVELPNIEHYEPTDTGESPLAGIKDWVNTECPRCGGPAKRETDTMPNWAGSSWYFLRYCDPKNNKAFADAVKLKYWLPVDLYNGGMEHTTLHLLYSRFWNKFLYDCGLVPVSEPYARRVSHGMVLAADGKKMSKSLGNVINPDEVVTNVGADSLRLYEMFMGPFADTIPWSMEGVKGVRRFLEKIWNLGNVSLGFKTQANEKETINRNLHKTIKKITDDIENMKFNTAVSAMMIFVNEAQAEGLAKDELEKFLIVLAPFAPHLAEELWSRLGHKQSIFKEKWPAYDANLTKDEIVRLAIQVNGKLRDTMEAAADISADEAKAKALASEKVKKWPEGKLIAKVIVVKNRLVNIVVK